MLFNSFIFLLVFLPLAILVCLAADDYPRFRTWALVALSLIFYGYWDVRFLPLMIGSIIVNWLVSRLFVVTRSTAVIVAALAANLSVLGAFKYSNFFGENVAAFFGEQFVPLRLALPLGISFFTFHHIMYLVDLKRGFAPLYALDRYALYICFFPQAIAGPLARWSDVIDQFGRRLFKAGWERRCTTGALFIVIGLLQKVGIADQLAPHVDAVYARAQHGPILNGDAWTALAFAFQVFFDFAGYSDVAIGIALIFGIELPRNFDAPFRATSILEFWRRWHMTLARFLRDYVFTPLTRLRFGGLPRTGRLLAALIITMALCGLWHGAGWNFVLWGTLQGLALATAASWPKRFLRIPPIVGWAATVGFFVLSIVIFRARSLTEAWQVYQGLAVFPYPYPNGGRNTTIIAVICAIVLPPSHEIVRKLSEQPRSVTAFGAALFAIIVIAMIGREQNYEFIYFQF